MFCLMDVSGSMGEREKDLAKRFFMLLHLFLKRRYERVDIVFIRHTHEAQEVDEQEFFYRPRDRRHRSSRTALEEDAGDRRRSATHRRLEHLCGPGLRRRQLSRRLRATAWSCSNEAILPLMPILRLYRDPRRARDGSVRDDEREQGPVARLRTVLKETAPNFAMKRVAKPRRHLPGVPRAVRQAAEKGAAP